MTPEDTANVVDRETTVPVSFSQRQLWILDQLRPGDSAYHLSVAFRADGRLDGAALERSLTEIVRRHEILRTTFPVVGDEPRQKINPPTPFEIAQTDLRAVPADVREARALEAIQREGRRAFDLAGGPLFRARVLWLAEDQHVLVLTMHHIVSDGWSIGVLYRELGVLYDAYRSGRASPLPDLPVQYGDFAVWQRERLRDEVLERLVAYWRDQLTNAPALCLPTDHPRPQAPGTHGADELMPLGGELANELNVLARQEGATRFMAMLAAFTLLLARYSGAGDVVVGIPMAGRDQAELQPLIGFFVNLLPLRATMTGRTTFRDLVRQVRDTTLAAYEHQELPFDVLVDSLLVEKPSDRNPIFQVTFAAQDVLVQPLAITDLRVQPFEPPAERTRFDLEAHVLDGADGLRVGFVYNTDLFEAATVRRMLAHYITLLNACAAHPDKPVAMHPLLSGAERDQVLEEWNATACVHPRIESVPALISERAAVQPDAVAVAGPGSPHEELTYRELDRRANQLAHWLRLQDVGPEAPVGVLLDRSTDLAVALLGVLKAGGAYIPLDPSYPDERLAYMVADSRLRLILTTKALSRRAPVSGPRVVCLDVEGAMLAAQPAVAPLPEICPDHLAYVIYTSGSTGTPKGVAVTHDGLANLIHWHNRRYDISPADRATLVASVGFDASVWELWPYLVAGARVSVMDDDARSSPERLWDWLRRERISVTFLPTPLAEAALRVDAPGGMALRYLLTGGDRLRASLKKTWPFTFINHYGPTENTVVSTSGPVEQESDAAAAPSIGRPIDNVQAYVLDEQLAPLPVGVVGELYIGGRSLARGYLQRPRQTAESFVPDPFGTGAGSRLYRTGDLVRWQSDGTLDFVGRRDGQVKIRGFRIELGEIEAALARTAGVDAAVVTVRGDGDAKRIVGYIVPHPGLAADPSAVREGLKRHLPSYMVPAAIVTVAALPLTPNGKVDRAALPEPRYESRASSRHQEAPRTPVEATLGRIWAEVLRLDRVGVHDNFFDVGGDSILSIQIASRAARAGLRISPRHFFQHQTIAELAAATTDPADLLSDQGPVIGTVPLTAIQQWFFEQAQPCPDHFNQAVLLTVRPDVVADVIRRAIDALLAHHDALRSRFVREGTTWSQRIDDLDRAASFDELDLTTLAERDQSAAVERTAVDLQAAGLNLSEGPLLRAAFFALGDGRPGRLLIVIHHLVVDAVSWRILLEDLQTAVDHLQQGRAVQFAAKTTSFKQWSERLRTHAASHALESEREFWRSRSASATEQLPVDDARARDRNTIGASSRHTCAFTPDETGALLREVPRACGARINEVLLASVARALAQWSRASSVCFDVEGHGREEIVPDADLSRTVGWFTSIYPLRITLPSAPDALKMLAHVQEQMRLVPHAGLGYGLLRYLAADASTAETVAQAEPDVSFNYLGQLDGALPDAGAFSLAPESAGPDNSPLNRRRHLLDVNARISGGVLHVDWTFCPAIHDAATVARLARDVAATVREVIARARLAPRRAPTANDFPLAKIDDQTLKLLAVRYGDLVIEDVYPLTPLQHGMLVHSLARRGSGAFVTQIDLVLEGEIQAGPFREAWRRLQAQHAILRTGFAEVGDGEFRQVVVGNPPLPWTEHDWSLLPDHESAARFDALLHGERLRGFTLDEAPLMRLALVRTGRRRCHLVWTHHHALLDGWSVAMLLEEMIRHYDACLANRETRGENRPEYRQYIAWLLAQDHSSSQAFWRKLLDGFTAPTTLSVDHAARARAHSPGRVDEQELWLDTLLTRSLTDAAARNRVTMNTVAQGAWALLLSRYSGERDVVFGTAVAGRPAELPGVDRMVGLFLNGVPTRIDVDPDQPVASWLVAVQSRHVEIRQHEHDALSDIQEWSDVPRGRPLFETTLAFENYPVAPTLDVAARSMGVVDFKLVAPTSAALHFRVVPGERLRLMISHDRERFGSDTVVEMLKQLEWIFRQIVEHASGTVGSLTLLTRSAASRLPDPGVIEPPSWDGAVHEQIAAQARMAGERPAIVEDGRVTSYAELDDRGNRLACALTGARVHREQVIGLLAPRGAALVSAMLGVLRAGAAFTILDPAYPSGRLTELLDVADAQIVVYGPGGDVPEWLSAWAGRSPGRRLVPLDELQTAPPAPERVCLATAPDDLAYVAFTSGSTGRPRAVLGRHGALAHYASWLRDTFQLGPADRFSMLTALSHDPLLRDVFPPLQLGATLCVPGGELFGHPGALSRWMAAQRISAANLTPAMAQLLLEGAEATTMGALRFAFFVGEPLPVPIVERLWRAAPLVTCVNLYGATETQQALAHFVIARENSESPGPIIPVGRGIRGVQLTVVRDGRQVAGIGEVGEIWMSSSLLARGYLGDPELTAAQFMEDPFGPGTGRWYRTGDRGRYLATGDVLVLGRMDDQVKIRGFRVEPGELEAFLMRQPGAREAAVTVHREEGRDPLLIAHVAGNVDAAELRQRARKHFPDHMVPARFVCLDRLPRTPSGKIDRKSLAVMAPAAAPDADYVAPSNPVETRLAELWAQLLQVERVGVQDSFFDLGGHSIIAARLMTRIRDEFAVELQIADLFEHPRISELGALIASAVNEENDVVSRLADEIRGLSPEELRALLEDAAASDPGAIG